MADKRFFLGRDGAEEAAGEIGADGVGEDDDAGGGGVGGDVHPVGGGSVGREKVGRGLDAIGEGGQHGEGEHQIGAAIGGAHRGGGGRIAGGEGQIGNVRVKIDVGAGGTEIIYRLRNDVVGIVARSKK